jgi:hypothetical protein
MSNFLRRIFGFFKRKPKEKIIEQNPVKKSIRRKTREIREKWLNIAYRWHRTKYSSRYELHTQTQDIKVLSVINLGKKPSPEEIRHAEEIFQSWKKYPLCQKQFIEHIAQESVPLGSKCLICGTIDNLMRHHQDYSKPLEIVTLCSHHHVSVHLSEPRINALYFIIDIERKLAEQRKPKPLNR